MMMNNRILIVEDDPAMSVALRDGFEFEKYAVEMAADGDEGLRLATRGDHDLMILDVMLPKKSGLDVCKELRKNGSQTPIIMLTARGQEIDKIVGLKLGADDYVTKPFGLLELLARVEALLRRDHAPERVHRECFGALAIDRAARAVYRNEAAVDLAPKEFDLLIALVRRNGAVATRLELMREVWGYSDAVITRTIDTHIAELRRKLETDPARPEHIVTVRKVGYRWA
jgi:DNA-binding response OmpR family regulator